MGVDDEFAEYTFQFLQVLQLPVIVFHFFGYGYELRQYGNMDYCIALFGSSLYASSSALRPSSQRWLPI